MKNNNDNLYEKSKFVTITLDDASTVEAEVVFTFEENGDVFILYAIDDIVYPAKISDDDQLITIENDEWEIVEKIFNEFIEEDYDEENEM